MSSMKIDVASVKPLFDDVLDNDGNGILSAGDRVEDGIIRTIYNFTPDGEITDGSFRYESGYELTAEDVASAESVAAMLHEKTGRLVRLMKGTGLFAKDAYLAVSHADSTDVESLFKIGKTVFGQARDVPDERVDLSYAGAYIRETFLPLYPDFIGYSTLAQYKRSDRWKARYDKNAEKKNTAVKTLQDNWFYLDRESTSASARSLVKIESAERSMGKLQEKTRKSGVI